MKSRPWEGTDSALQKGRGAWAVGAPAHPRTPCSHQEGAWTGAWPLREAFGPKEWTREKEEAPGGPTYTGDAGAQASSLVRDAAGPNSCFTLMSCAASGKAWIKGSRYFETISPT